MPPSTIWMAVLVVLLALTIAKSTVSAAWVPVGIDGVPFVAVGAALLMAFLASTRLPGWVSIAIGVVAGLLVAMVVMGNQFRLERPGDPTGFGLIQLWIVRVADGTAFGDTAFVGFVITLLMWVTGAWLAWCVVRWRQPLIGLIPGAAAFSTNVLNTANQQGYTFIFLALTLGLLLYTTYSTLVAKALAARMKMTGDARWDFWETGLVVTAALLVVGIMLPPISTYDRTATMESSLIQGWANVTNKLNQVSTRNGGGAPTSSITGFSQLIQMNKSLTKSATPVFTYALTAGPYPGPSYFRGVNLSVTEIKDGVPTWDFGDTDYTTGVAAESVVTMAEDYKWLALSLFVVAMINPPGGDDRAIYFYPGQFFGIDKPAIAHEALVPPAGTFSAQLATVDRLTAIGPSFSSKGIYNVLVGYPDVSEDELRSAGSNYGAWLAPYMTLPSTGYRPAYAIDYIHQLALDVTAGMTNPYDKATAIETFLRSGAFAYNLNPKQAPTGTDPMYYFLKTSREGYCQYFAMAMGEMLRSLGIPTRLVSGYGPGGIDEQTHRLIVRDEDAHAWVETYFPSYGWVPFEPTNDGVYQPIKRPTSRAGACFTDNHCNNPSPVQAVVTAVTKSSPRIKDPGATDEPVSTNPTPLRWLNSSTIPPILGVIGALMILLIAIGARYLRPRTVSGVWRRVLVLARLAGAELSPGETPRELDKRLGRAFPEAATYLHALTDAFVVAAYAPPDEAPASKAAVMESWSLLRPVMLRRVAARIRPGQR
ncbi:MAG TPA: transglutaminase domain-containing protein [Candidatus Dormibacteraeota bacterium]|nr:transglutaminase domain-containing protein [Candidatus Dormibacteraeota bacterium]